MNGTTELIAGSRQAASNRNVSYEELYDIIIDYMDGWEWCEDNHTDHMVQDQWSSDIEILKTHVRDYVHKDDLPTLPLTPHGALYGMGFIYDEDKDDRVLMALHDLRHLNHTIVAIAEHEATVRMYTRIPTMKRYLDVCDDDWCSASATVRQRCS